MIKKNVRRLFLFAWAYCSVAAISGKQESIAKAFAAGLPPGVWRASLIRQDGQMIPFNFETRDSAGRKILYIMNGKEKLLVDQIRQDKDSFFIQLPFFDSRFALRISDDSLLVGEWIKNNGDRTVSMPFMAIRDEPERFSVALNPRFNITGRWSTRFHEGGSDEEAIGEFIQSGHRVTGTFLTTTGDYRFLDGVVDGDTLKLSTFDGGHAYYFRALIDSNQRLTNGQFYAGAVNMESWDAVRNEKAALPDEYGLTRLKDPASAGLYFKFPDMDSNMVSIRDDRFKNKVVIIQIMGSWCPNCMDETRFLSDFYRKNRDRGVEIVALAYERTTAFDKSRKSLQAFKNRFRVAYPILITGVTVSDSLKTEKTLPQLERILGFPTTLFLDKKGQIKKIATGFNGPGTGDHYEIFKKDFSDQVTALLKE